VFKKLREVGTILDQLQVGSDVEVFELMALNQLALGLGERLAPHQSKGGEEGLQI